MKFNWQQKGWPKATVNRAALRDELKAFGTAFLNVKSLLQSHQNSQAVMMNALVDEAMKTSAIEGVRIDESVVMSSICKALGMTDVPFGFTKDVRAEGVAQMVLAVRRDWREPISAKLIASWHGALLANDPRGITVGAFRSHVEPMRVVRRDAYGEIEIRFEAPPSSQVPLEITRYVARWKRIVKEPVSVALKATMLHPHFESIHPFEDGNGRVGRALVAKVLAEGLECPLVLPISVVIDRHRKDYYEAIHEASRSLDWTNWAKFFIPILTETLLDFVTATKFIAAKVAYLNQYEGHFSDRARKVVLRMFRDGATGVSAGLSAAKWMRLTKVSKATATRDLSELAATGAVVAEGESVATRYRLNLDADVWADKHEPANEPLSMAINEAIKSRPGINKPQLMKILCKSKVTIERALAALVLAGRIEHRGSKKTGGYYCRGTDPIDESR